MSDASMFEGSSRSSKGVHFDGSPDSILALLDGDSCDDTPAGAGHTDAGDNRHLDLFDPRLFGYSADDIVVGLVGDQEGGDLAPYAVQELNDAAAHSFSDTRKAARKKSELVSFSEDDFEGAQRSAFILMRYYKNLLFAAAATNETKWQAIEWFFTGSDDGTPTFELACMAFGARIDVVRLRIHYEFFLRWFTTPEEFPFTTVEVPEIIAGEIAYIAGIEGQSLARFAWNRPGIPTEQLVEAVVKEVPRSSTASVRAALDALEERFVMSQQAGFWYTTGRNPHLLRKRISESNHRLMANVGGSIYWSRLL